MRAAALAALAEIGCDEADLSAVQRALHAPAWQVREGAARALSGATAELAVAKANVRGIEAAMAEVREKGAQAAFLLEPTPIDDGLRRAIAFFERAGMTRAN